MQALDPPGFTPEHLAGNVTVDHVVGPAGRPQSTGGETVGFLSHLVCQLQVNTETSPGPGQEPRHPLSSLDILGLAILYVEHLTRTVLVLFSKKQS